MTVPPNASKSHDRAKGHIRAALALIVVVGWLMWVAPAAAESIDAIVVTATRIPEPVAQIPADISALSGGEILARGAADMAGVLALVPGAEAPAGGDAGPSSAVPSF